MFIDEMGELTETSDHNVVLTYLNLKGTKTKWEKNKTETRTSPSPSVTCIAATDYRRNPHIE